MARGVNLSQPYRNNPSRKLNNLDDVEEKKP